MSFGIEYNRDLQVKLASLITNASIESVMEQQPVRWRPAAWQARKLPHPQVLDELQQEYAAHGTIRRSFVFTYRDRSSVELFIAVMATLFPRCWPRRSSAHCTGTPSVSPAPKPPQECQTTGRRSGGSQSSGRRVPGAGRAGTYG